MKKSIIERLEELVVDYKNYVKSLEKRIIELEMELEKNKNLKDFTNFKSSEYVIFRN